MNKEMQSKEQSNVVNDTAFVFNLLRKCELFQEFAYKVEQM